MVQDGIKRARALLCSRSLSHMHYEAIVEAWHLLANTQCRLCGCHGEYNRSYATVYVVGIVSANTLNVKAKSLIYLKFSWSHF